MFTNLDFEQIKQSLIEFLRSEGTWTDFDYEGSNISTLLDLLAYNSQYAAFMANMVASESFLSTATVRDNVVSHAKALGYSPTGTTGAGAFFNLRFSLNLVDYPSGLPKSLTIQPGAVFSVSYSPNGDSKNVSYTISAKKGYTTSVGGDGVARFENIYLSEGIRVTERYTVSATDTYRQYKLNNENIDLTTVVVTVQENPPTPILTEYTNAKDLIDIDSTKKVFWLDEVQNGVHNIIFGDGVFGFRPAIGAVITVSYLVSSGVSANGVQGNSNYAFIGTVIDSNGNRTLRIPTIENTPKLAGGATKEDIHSIKFRAPKSFAAQNRAVTANDYEAIIRQAYAAIEDIYVYGGESQYPPQYGKVFIVVKPTYGNYLSQEVKQNLSNELKKYKVASTRIQFVDPGILNIETISNISYNSSLTKLSIEELRSNIRDSLTRYSLSPSIRKFNGLFRFSKVISLIDAADESIVRSDSSVVIRRDLPIVYNTAASYSITYGNPLKTDTILPVVYSDGFNINTSTETHYLSDDNKGNIILYYYDAGKGTKVVSNYNFGTVDYENGIVKLAYDNSITITNTSTLGVVQIRAVPRFSDIRAYNEIYLNYDIAASTINITAE